MQDEINEKVIALSIRTTKLTAEMLQKSIRFMLSQIKKQLDKPVQHHGKQTLKQLMKQNAGVSSIEITDSNSSALRSAMSPKKLCYRQIHLLPDFLRSMRRCLFDYSRYLSET